jgi:hypothetical protein
VGTRYGDHVTPLYPRNVGTNLPTGGIVRSDCGHGIIRGRPELLYSTLLDCLTLKAKTVYAATSGTRPPQRHIAKTCIFKIKTA